MPLISTLRSALRALMPSRARASNDNGIRLCLVWDGSGFVTGGVNEGDMCSIATWDPQKKKAAWVGRKPGRATTRVALSESISHAGMCEPPIGDTEQSRENALRYNLDLDGCPVKMEDAIAMAFPGEGNKHKASHLLFAVSKDNLEQLAAAARGLGLSVELAEPWPASLARGAMARADFERSSERAAVFVPAQRNAWLFVFHGGELQWLWHFEWGRNRWPDAAQELRNAVESFNDRVSAASLSTLHIAHSAEDEALARAAADELNSPYLKTTTLLIPGSSDSLPAFLVLEGLRHA